jgi:peptide-methionine (S)-S-oxide reductase
VHVASVITEKAKELRVDNLQEQIDYALRLVAWSLVAPKYNVQIGLLDILLNAGASPGGIAVDALVNRNFEAAKHLIDRGGKLTLATAACLGRWSDATRLAKTAGSKEKQLSLTLAALTGQPDALAFLVKQNVNLDEPSTDLYSHAPALHHAVSSGSLEAVKVLVEAGASVNIKDTVYYSTPLGWAEYGKQDKITAYLRNHGAQ